MKFAVPTAELFVPDGVTEAEALDRTTHLAIGAHQDDLEIMAYHGIAECFGRTDKWFAGVVVTNGSGSSRTGLYADFTDEQMMQVRRLEQKKAAYVGEFGAQFLLDFTSGQIKDPTNRLAVDDLKALIEACRPEIVYTHNLADKHDTHIGVALKTIAALREVAPEARPRKVYGCEVWRDLDWMVDEDKVAFDVSARENIAASLVGVFDSQICGGKRYDLATAGRRRAHATYFQSHSTDEVTGLTWGMDLTPLVEDPSLDPKAFTLKYVDRFRADVEARIGKMGSS